MSFADYLRDRISNDYKNLLNQKLEEIRQQTEQLKNQLTPSLDEREQSLRQMFQEELAKVQDLFERQVTENHNRISTDFQSLVDSHIASLYDNEVSPSEQQVQGLLSDIISHVPAPPLEKNKDIESLVHLMQKLDQQSTQSEILNTLLMHISGWVDRAVLFVVKGEQASGWAALGLGADWNTDRVRALRVDLNKQTILNDVLQNGEMSFGNADKYSDNNEIYLTIGSKFPKAVIACPIKVRGKIAGVVYSDVDREFEQNPDLPDLLFLATRAAGFAIDLLPLKPKSSPATAVKERPPVAVTPPPVPQHVEPPASPPPPPPPEPASSAVHPADVVEVEVTAPVPTVEQKAPEPEEEIEEAEGTVIMPAIVPPPVLSEEEQKLHDDAKRFARLLVSEIKLYNEAQVAAGREHRDLYERLKEDIERSRRMYQDRVPAHIHSSTNYFYEELVRTLANGDPQLLGM
jgi:hypothetical protein